MNAALKWLLRPLALGVLTLAVAATGCVDERSFFISTNKSKCLEADTSSEGELGGLGSGILDVSPAGGQIGYVFYPVLRNEMLSTKAADGEPERNRLILRRFEVELNLGILGTLNQTSPGLTSFAVLTSGLIEPDGGTLTTSVAIVPDALVPELRNLPSAGRAAIVAKIRAVADHNGSDLKSVEFEYPIEVCSGCLVTDLKDCPTTKPEGLTPTNECGLPQDLETSCCRQSDGRQRCFTAKSLAALPAAKTP